MKGNLTLKIKDLALLKQNPEQYMEKQLYATKTHDGTSSTPIKAQIEDFYKESVGSMYRHTRAVSSDGEELNHIMTVADDKKNEYYDLEFERLFDTDEWDYDNSSDVHLLTKPSGENNNSNVEFFDKNGNSYLLPSLDDMSILEELNNDGGYIFRSRTLVSDDGTTTTLIKNNKFSPEDESKLWKTMVDMESDVRNHNQQLKDRANEIDSEHMKQWDRENPMDDKNLSNPEVRAHNAKRWKEIDKSRKQAQKQAVEELGDTKTYINDKWGPKIEEECNVKLKMQKQDVKKYTGGKGYDEDDYDNDWAEEHDIYDYSIGGGAFASEGAFWQWKEGH